MISVILMNTLKITCVMRIILITIMSRINFRKKSFVISARMLWNELPFDIRTVSGYRFF